MTQGRSTVEEVRTAPPVFFLHDEAPDDITIPDVCEAAERMVGYGKITGAQRNGALWRIYPVSAEVRPNLVGARLSILGKSVLLRNHNPFLNRDASGGLIPGTRITVDGLPISVSNVDIEGVLRRLGTKMRSPLLYEKARQRDGKLTRWLTGRRFAWIDLPTTHLPNKTKVGDFTARIFYREQPKALSHCFLCQQTGHRAAQCTNEPVCAICKKTGHRSGDSICRGAWVEVRNARDPVPESGRSVMDNERVVEWHSADEVEQTEGDSESDREMDISGKEKTVGEEETGIGQRRDKDDNAEQRRVVKGPSRRQKRDGEVVSSSGEQRYGEFTEGEQRVRQLRSSGEQRERQTNNSGEQREGEVRWGGEQRVGETKSDGEKREREVRKRGDEQKEREVKGRGDEQREGEMGGRDHEQKEGKVNDNEHSEKGVRRRDDGQREEDVRNDGRQREGEVRKMDDESTEGEVRRRNEEERYGEVRDVEQIEGEVRRRIDEQIDEQIEGGDVRRRHDEPIEGGEMRRNEEERYGEVRDDEQVEGEVRRRDGEQIEGGEVRRRDGEQKERGVRRRDGEQRRGEMRDDEQRETDLKRRDDGLREGEARSSGDEHKEGEVRSSGGEHKEGEVWSSGGEHKVREVGSSGGEHKEGEVRSSGGEHKEREVRSSGGEHKEGEVGSSGGEHKEGEVWSSSEQRQVGEVRSNDEQIQVGEVRSNDEQRQVGEVRSTEHQKDRETEVEKSHDSPHLLDDTPKRSQGKNKNRSKGKSVQGGQLTLVDCGISRTPKRHERPSPDNFPQVAQRPRV